MLKVSGQVSYLLNSVPFAQCIIFSVTSIEFAPFFPKQSTQEDLTNSEWATEKDSRANIPVFLSDEAIGITTRSHGKDRRREVK